MRAPPFVGEPRVSIVLPQLEPTLGGHLSLLELERAGFEAELGAPVEFTTSDPGSGPRWLLVLDPRHTSPPVTLWEPGTTAIVSRASDVEGLFEGLNLWRTAQRLGGAAEGVDCDTIDEAIERVVSEVACTYPSFELHGHDWEEICARHVERVRSAEDPLAALQAWLAELDDSHTWVWPGHGNLPYVVEVSDDAATFVHVEPGSPGGMAGVRPGWRLVSVDGCPPDCRAWLARTAAPPHSRPFLAGRRLLAGPTGTPRKLVATDSAAHEVLWEEEPATRSHAPVVTWRRLSSGAGYLRIAQWLGGIEESIGAALADLNGSEKLILDLRRNPGGSLVAAANTRDRFLRTKTTLGSIRYSDGSGGLAPAVTLASEPPSSGVWPGRLIVLTDALTFSSSEDFLLGLQGLEHVTVAGSPSGGGSGRPRSIRLLPGWTLTVSTALTYDRDGHCVEGAGIPVDVPVLPAAGSDAVLAAAEAL